MCALLAALAIVALLVWAPVARATTYTFSPSADARVKEQSPSSNYGSLAYLATNSCSCDRQEVYLRFTVTGLDGPVVKAVLRGRTYDSVDGPTSDGPAVYRTSGSWTESGLTWKNRPSSTGAALDDLGALGRNATFDMSVTSAVTGNGSVDFVLRQPAGDSMYVYSREHSTVAARPQLVVTTSAPTPTPTATATATPPPSATPTPVPPSDPYPMRGMYSRQSDGGFDKIAGSGHNLIDSGPGEIAHLSSGLKGLVWVGDYDGSTCSWEQSDAQIRSAVQANIGNSKVGVWFIADEPWVGGKPRCPTTPSQMKARTDLIHSIDPKAKTLMVMDANSAQESLDQLPLWKGTVDYVGIDPYVCWQGQKCQYEWIDTLARAADAAGLDYWGVVQTFGDPSGQGAYMCTTTSGCGRARLPTAGEIHEQFVHWRATRMSGYLSFAWRWPSGTPSLWLENHPELQLQLAFENSATAGGQTPTPTPTPSVTPTPTASATPTPTPTATPGTDPVVVAAGDIAGDGSGDTATAAVVSAINPDRVLTTGDNTYPDGALSDYQKWYAPTWGSFLSKTRPVPGNHDYHISGAAGYFDYFNGVGVNDGPAGQRGKGYYSFNLGSWHLIALNNYVSMSAGSAQEQWLRADLSANAGKCTLAYWHAPRFTSGEEHSNSTSTTPLWNALYAAGADVVLNGHNHQYERFAPQTPTGAANPNGIRQFVVGTGGGGLYPFATTPQPNSEVRDYSSYGVLKLTLRPGGYEWAFVSVAGGKFSDSGSGKC